MHIRPLHTCRISHMQSNFLTSTIISRHVSIGHSLAHSPFPRPGIQAGRSLTHIRSLEHEKVKKTCKNTQTNVKNTVRLYHTTTAISEITELTIPAY